MENLSKERVLAFKTASLIKDDELKQIGGGSSNNTTVYTTKQTADTGGNYDVGGDVRWD